MIRRPTSSLPSNGPELTPLIDIVFIVVVFLLLTANAQVLSLPVDIPDTDSSLAKAISHKQTITVGIHATSPHWVMRVQDSANVHFDTWQGFKNALIPQLNESASRVLIAPDADASAEKLLQVLALLNERTFSDVHILMEPEKH